MVILDAWKVGSLYWVGMRVLAIDYGTRRIGLATCDELQLTTRGLSTLESQGVQRDVKRLAEIADQMNCETLLVGLPLHLDGTRGKSAERAISLARGLRGITHRQVHLVDERLTSREADRRLPKRQKSKGKRSGERDREAARVILEDFLRLGLEATCPET